MRIDAYENVYSTFIEPTWNSNTDEHFFACLSDKKFADNLIN